MGKPVIDRTRIRMTHRALEALGPDITKLCGLSVLVPFCVRTGAPDCRMPPTAKGLAIVDIARKSLFQHDASTESRCS